VQCLIVVQQSCYNHFIVTPHLARGEFFGRTLKDHQAAGFSLSESCYSHGTTLGRHSHEQSYFGFVITGVYTENYAGRVRACQPNMLIYHPAGERHSQRFDKSAVQLFRIEVNEARLRDLGRWLDLDRPADFRDRSTTNLAHQLHRELVAPDAVSPLAIEGLVLELVAALTRLSHPKTNSFSRPPRWLKVAHELVRANFLEPMTLGNIAHQAGVHPVTLAREFRRYYLCTVGQMVRCERIQFACEEILKPEARLADVAVSAGFYDQSHFSRTFKQLTGLTPAQYRSNYGPR
jgi:AraC family transcriptional regulator